MSAEGVDCSADCDVMMGEENRPGQSHTATVTMVSTLTRSEAQNAVVMDMVTDVPDSKITEYFERYVDCRDVTNFVAMFLKQCI